jgi:hypothetical protein
VVQISDKNCEIWVLLDQAFWCTFRGPVVIPIPRPPPNSESETITERIKNIELQGSRL